MKKIFEHTFQNRHFWTPKIRGFGLGQTGEKYSDLDANSEFVTTLVLVICVITNQPSHSLLFIVVTNK